MSAHNWKPVNRGLLWSDGRTISRAAESDGTYAEQTQALLRAWDATDLAYIKATVDHTTGGLKVYTVNGTTPPASGMLFATIDTASSGDNTIVSAVTAKKIKVTAYAFVVAGATNVTWYSAAAGTKLSGAMPLTANGGIAVAGSSASHLFETATAQALVLNLSAGVQCSGHVSYFTE